MADLGIKYGFNLTFHAVDRTAKVFLCVGEEDNRVLVTGTTPLSRQAAVLNAIDENGEWGQIIQLWMVAEKNGALTARTPKVGYMAHVKPYYGDLKISDMALDEPRLTYPGNGFGRLLSQSINDRYYFIYAGVLETRNPMRGFDCTSFPMALLEVPRIAAPGYGSQLSNALEADKCGLEQVKQTDLVKLFTDNTIPMGIYIVFSEGHVMLYNSDTNTLFEFNFGGFRRTPAAQRLTAQHGLWWMRKLDEGYRSAFA